MIMTTEVPILIALMMLIDRIPVPSATNRRGRSKSYSDRLFLKALVIMVVRHLPKVHSLLAILEEPEMQPLRDLLVENGRYPTRRTFGRRLKAIPETLPAQIARYRSWSDQDWLAWPGLRLETPPGHHCGLRLDPPVRSADTGQWGGQQAGSGPAGRPDPADRAPVAEGGDEDTAVQRMVADLVGDSGQD